MADESGSKFIYQLHGDFPSFFFLDLVPGFGNEANNLARSGELPPTYLTYSTCSLIFSRKNENAGQSGTARVRQAFDVCCENKKRGGLWSPLPQMCLGHGLAVVSSMQPNVSCMQLTPSLHVRDNPARCFNACKVCALSARGKVVERSTFARAHSEGKVRKQAVFSNCLQIRIVLFAYRSCTLSERRSGLYRPLQNSRDGVQQQKAPFLHDGFGTRLSGKAATRGERAKERLLRPQGCEVHKDR